MVEPCLAECNTLLAGTAARESPYYELLESTDHSKATGASM